MSIMTTPTAAMRALERLLAQVHPSRVLPGPDPPLVARLVACGDDLMRVGLGDETVDVLFLTSSTLEANLDEVIVSSVKILSCRRRVAHVDQIDISTPHEETLRRARHVVPGFQSKTLFVMVLAHGIEGSGAIHIPGGDRDGADIAHLLLDSFTAQERLSFYASHCHVCEGFVTEFQAAAHQLRPNSYVYVQGLVDSLNESASLSYCGAPVGLILVQLYYMVRPDLHAATFRSPADREWLETLQACMGVQQIREFILERYEYPPTPALTPPEPSAATTAPRSQPPRPPPAQQQQQQQRSSADIDRDIIICIGVGVILLVLLGAGVAVLVGQREQHQRERKGGESG